jgi:hypothetical protein
MLREQYHFDATPAPSLERNLMWFWLWLMYRTLIKCKIKKKFSTDAKFDITKPDITKCQI